MNLKRYRVNNIQEALQLIKKDLGPEAVIVSTRQVKEGNKAFGLFAKTMLEVTAARDEKSQAKPNIQASSQATASGYRATVNGMPRSEGWLYKRDSFQKLWIYYWSEISGSPSRFAALSRSVRLPF